MSDVLPTPLPQRRAYRYYDLVMAGFVTVLLCSNLIGPGKSCAIDLGVGIVPDFKSGEGLVFSSLLVFGAGNIFFPISYIFGDVLTEVYGYARARKVIWAGFGAMIFATIMSQVIIALPINHAEPYNQVIVPAIETVFGNTWRIVVASMLAFWVGDFANSFVLAKMKVLTRGRFLWTRTIGSTIVGQGVDSMLFYPIAFAGIWDSQTLLKVSIFNWIFKVLIEVVMTPATYWLCNRLKRAEHEDFYDLKTNFTPFSLKD
ncbi:MAG: queuosine precursor transporter [Phycisphaerales bacterium]